MESERGSGRERGLDEGIEKERGRRERGTVSFPQAYVEGKPPPASLWCKSGISSTYIPVGVVSVFRDDTYPYCLSALYECCSGGEWVGGGEGGMETEQQGYDSLSFQFNVRFN